MSSEHFYFGAEKVVCRRHIFAVVTKKINELFLNKKGPDSID